MAQHQLDAFMNPGFVSKSRAVANSAAVTTDSVGTPANYSDMTALDAALNTADSSFYTQKRLDSMTLNDKHFALRSLSDAGTL